MNEHLISEFIDGYLDGVFLVYGRDSGGPLEGYGKEDVSPYMMPGIERQCRAMITRTAVRMGLDYREMTNGCQAWHKAGLAFFVFRQEAEQDLSGYFYDTDGEDFSHEASRFGAVSPFVGKDGKVWFE